MVMKRAILPAIRGDLAKWVDPEYRAGAKRFVKEGIVLLGVKTPIVRKISAKYFSQVKRETRHRIYSLCEELCSSGYSEERTIAFDWAFRLRKQYAPSDFTTFESWLKEYVENWGACDDFCTHALGAFILQFPEFLPKVKAWARSANRWARRASAVSLIYSIRRRRHLESAFEIADTLLLDQDYLVQKGYGWMLKEASNHYPDEVFEYVMSVRHVMPRTALRYAIEKLPAKLRLEAMKKEFLKRKG
jgi:3-methyladenine DNA glycosylase AlkD